MPEIIRKARDTDNREIEVKIPLYLYSEDATFKDYINAPAINEVDIESDSILSLLSGKGKEYTDISGMECLMLAWVNDKVYKTNVIIKGRTANHIIVEIEGADYSVYRTQVIFTKRD